MYLVYYGDVTFNDCEECYTEEEAIQWATRMNKYRFKYIDVVAPGGETILQFQN